MKIFMVVWNIIVSFILLGTAFGPGDINQIYAYIVLFVVVSFWIAFVILLVKSGRISGNVVDAKNSRRRNLILAIVFLIHTISYILIMVNWGIMSLL